MYKGRNRTRQQFRVRGWLPAQHRLSICGRARRGRPRRFDSDAVMLIEALMVSSPADHGYDQRAWTVPLLLEVLANRDYSSCRRTLRKLLHDLGWRWDRQYREWRPS